MPATVRESSVFPICLREFDILQVSDVTPGMRRIVVGGPAMDAHVRDGVAIPPVRSEGFDDDIKILPPDPVTGGFPFAVPRNTDTGAVDWTPGSFEYTRTYTVRRFDAEKRELTIDFALHRTGLASTWARRVRPGEKILIAGPKHSAGLPVGADWMLIAGDETALPAIEHCLEKLPPTLPATVVIEVAEPSHRQELTCAAPIDVTWLFRSENGGESRLVETVQAQPWREGRPYIWVAGETLTIKPLRRWARRERELPAEFVEIAGYWRHREVTSVVGDPELVDVAAEENAGAHIHELAELLPPLALRTAVTLGVFAAIDGGATTVDRLAAECGADPAALGKLLRHLATLDLLRRDGDGYALTDAGSILADPDGFIAGALHFDSIHTRLDLAFLGLLDAVRTGAATGLEGMSFTERMREPRFAEDYHGEAAHDAVYRAAALPDAIDLDGVTSVAIVGEGAGVYADTLLRLRPGLRIRLVGLPSVLDRAFADVADERRGLVERVDASEFTALAEPVDLALAVDVVDTLPDADARVLLGALTASAARVVVVTDLLDPQTSDEHDTEDDLRRLCLHGAGRRTAGELTALATAAGAGEPRTGPLGWGANVVEFAGLTQTPGTARFETAGR